MKQQEAEKKSIKIQRAGRFRLLGLLWLVWLWGYQVCQYLKCMFGWHLSHFTVIWLSFDCHLTSGSGQILRPDSQIRFRGSLFCIALLLCDHAFLCICLRYYAFMRRTMVRVLDIEFCSLGWLECWQLGTLAQWDPRSHTGFGINMARVWHEYSMSTFS